MFSDVATVGAGASSAIVNEGVSGGVFLELRSIQATKTADAKLIVEVDKDTILTINMNNLDDTPEKALGVFVIADERKTLKVTIQNNGAGAATVHYLLNALLKKKAEE